MKTFEDYKKYTERESKYPKREYKKIYADTDVDNRLNVLGENGWELVTGVTYQHYNSFTSILIFKRPKN